MHVHLAACCSLLQGYGDPFGELASTGQHAIHADFKPTRRPPPKPAAPNPFSPSASAADDPFGLLAATVDPPAAIPGIPPAAASAPAQLQQRPAQQAWDDDVFGIFTSASTHASSSSSTAVAAPPSYQDAAAACPPPPAYDAAASLPPAYDTASSCPPAYEQALDLAPPPSYEAIMKGAAVQSPHQAQQGQQQLRPACAPPVAPNPAGAAVGPLTAARPSRAAPAPPGASLAPARAAPAAPCQHSPADARQLGLAGTGHSSMASGSAHATAGAAAGLAGLHLSGPEAHAGVSSSRGQPAAQCAAAITGNVGAAPKGGGFGGQQVRQYL